MTKTIWAALAAIIVLFSFGAHAQTYGTVPPGLPPTLSVGLFEDTGNTWMKSSGVPWNIRYRYLTYRWSTNWGFGARDGSFALNFFKETDSQGFIPAIAYYEIYDLGSGGQLSRMQNPATMREYFEDWKLLMLRAKDFGKPVLVLVEPDATGFCEGETKNLQGNSTPAAIASSGMPELAGLPDTVSGWGLAFLQIRKSVGANNVVLGLHVSGWADGNDIMYYDVASPLQPHVDTVYSFLAPFGLVSNVTGQTYDVLVGDPLDRDSDFYRLVNGEGMNRWWDASDTASVNSRSFNRYAEWMRLWNVKSQKRWVMWQLPLGNSLSRNICNNGSVGSGYKDNRTAYFFGAGSDAHRRLWMNNGAVALLFGAGESCQATQQTDNDYVKNNAKSYLTNLLALPGTTSPTDSGVVSADAGAPVADAGMTTKDAGVVTSDAGAAPPTGDNAQYNFEGGTQGFAGASAVNISTAQAFAGARSLAVSFSGLSGTKQVQTSAPLQPPAGAVLTYHVYLSNPSVLTSLQVYAQENSTKSWRWNSFWTPSSNLKTGWNTLSVTLPVDLAPLQSIGVEFQLAGTFTGTVYIDSISWGTGTSGTVQNDAGVASQPDAGSPTKDAGSSVIDAGSSAKDAGTAVVDAGTSVQDAGVVVPGKLPKAFRIQTIGDSTTESVDSSFRCAMHTTLTAQGYAPTFVGTLTHPYGCTEGSHHDGHAGWTAEDIAASMQSWIKASAPDVIIYNSGTNSYRWWTTETGTTLGARQEAFIDSLFTAAPNAKVIVWTLNPQSLVTVPPNSQNSQTMESDYNNQIKQAVARLQAKGRQVVLVDTYGVLVVQDAYDGVHPDFNAGANKLAPAFIAALRTWLP